MCHPVGLVYMANWLFLGDISCLVLHLLKFHCKIIDINDITGRLDYFPPFQSMNT